MEKNRCKIVFSFFMFFILHGSIFAQDLSVGPVSGLNFSNLRGDMIYDAWKAKTGPVNGIFVRLSLGNWLAFRTGGEFTGFYYQQNLPRGDYYPYPIPLSIPSYSSSSFAPGGCIIGPSSPVRFDYKFFRVPLLLEWRTPGRLSFGFGTGAYYSFLMNDEYTGKDKDLRSEEYREDNFPPENDWGWILSTNLDFALNKRWNIFLEGRTTYGKEVYYKGAEGKNGSTELMFGVGFSPFAQPERKPAEHIPGRRIEVMPHAGVSFSKSVSPGEKTDYDFMPALNSGIDIKFKADSSFSILSGARIEQKGYRITEPSQSRIVFEKNSASQSLVSMQSDILLDYVTIPVLGELSFGNRFSTSLQLGMYYSLLQNARSIGEETNQYSYENGYEVRKVYFSQNMEGWFKHHDLGALAGIRFEYRLFHSTKVYAAASREWGFIGLADKKDDNISASPPVILEKFKNRSWTTALGLSIPLVQHQRSN